jgi:glutathione S-transferase
LVDGLTVWGRELRHRPEQERSPTIVEHERQRSRRMFDVWEKQIDDPLMRGRFNMAQITLACALIYHSQTLGSSWRKGHPALGNWYDSIEVRQSVAAVAQQVAR